MIRTLRLLFLSRALREKLLLLGFIAIALMWWGSVFAKRAVLFNRERRMTTARLNEQTKWIRDRGAIEEKAQKAASSFDPARTLNANQLAAAVEQLANQAGLRANASSLELTTTPSGQFAVHALRYRISGADWEKLSKFYESLQHRAPYMAIDSFTLSAAPNNPSQLTVELRVVSVEIIR
ncbi:MAG: GspMb/PilO family protein [Opitutaceae bacterium]|nr:GspMb/PilO family protein [Opitutaceae bacterium]